MVERKDWSELAFSQQINGPLAGKYLERRHVVRDGTEYISEAAFAGGFTVPDIRHFVFNSLFKLNL